MIAPAVIVKNRNVSLFLIDVCQIRCHIARGGHSSLKRYPTPRTVSRYSGILRILLELLAQVADVHVDRALVAEGGVAPDPVQQHVARVDAAGMARQHREDLELDVRELHRLAVQLGGALREVDVQVAAVERLLAAVELGPSRRGAARPARGCGTRASRTAW